MTIGAHLELTAWTTFEMRFCYIIRVTRGTRSMTRIWEVEVRPTERTLLIPNHPLNDTCRMELVRAIGHLDELSLIILETYNTRHLGI